MSSLPNSIDSSQIPKSRHKRKFDPHRFVGALVIYGLALDGAVRFLHWLTLSIISEFAR